MTAAKLKLASDPVSEARAALAERIERRNALRDRIEALKAESQKAAEDAFAQNREVARLEGELEKVPALQRRELRKALTEATEFAQDLRDHRDEVAAKIKAAENSLQLASTNFKEKVSAVVKSDPGPAKLVERYRRIKAEMVALNGTLRFIDRAGGLVNDRWDSDPYSSNYVDPAWREAIAALEEDADAPMPAVAEAEGEAAPEAADLAA